MTNLQAIDLLKGLEQSLDDYCELNDEGKTAFRMAITALEVFGLSEQLPSAQPEQRYTEEELRVFQHGISLSLLSKRSSQHWQYDEDTATEIKFLERLYEKVVADMRGEQDGRFNQQTGGD